MTLTGTNTLWASETAVGLFTEAGGTGASIGTPTVTTNTSATATVTCGSASGSLTITDASTGATATFTVSAGTITITSPVASQVFQRSGDTAGIGGTASIPISGTYTDTPTSIEASFNGGAWVTIVATPTGGTFSGTLTGQAAGQGTLSVRFTNNTAVTSSVSSVGIGDIYVIAGQSNAEGQGTNNQSYQTATATTATMFANDYAWKNLTDPVDLQTGQVDAVSLDSNPKGSCWPNLATRIMAYTKTPVAFVPCALSGSSITAWQPGANHDDRTTLYGSMHHRATVAIIGGVKAVLWWQGEQDAITSMSQATYFADFQTLSAAIATDLSCKIMPTKLQNFHF